MFKTWDTVDDLPFHGVRLPEIKLTDKELEGLELDDTSNLSILKALCRRGYKDKILKYPEKAKKATEYIERVKYELNILEKTNFLDYIILVWQVLNFCRTNNIPYGKG